MTPSLSLSYSYPRCIHILLLSPPFDPLSKAMATTALMLYPATSSSYAYRKLFHSSHIHCCEDTVGRPRKPQLASLNGLAGFPEKNALLTPTSALPPRPRRIILVRHGQSEGNVDESAYTRVPDPKIGLTKKGMQEAEDCGIRIREMIEKDGAPDWKVYFYVSPYKRTLETLQGLGKAFEPSRIAGVREEPRLREQDFGNFQDREKMRVEKAIRVLYGRFFYRFPNGESAADVYDRITGFRETLRADIDIGRFQPPGQRNPNMNLVIVSHGLTLRVFLMRWYKWTVEQFEGLNNFSNGGMIVMQTGYGGRYSLLVHHTPEELREFGLTDEMLTDQEWQKFARPGELNYDILTTGQSFFTHFDTGNNKT
ncbi:PREDICTED: phosphoglycerate mutase-like protein AT74 [Nelumbo nucifera]|uniref:Phosphoglycerate mutase-like protein AT74 n=1 Tax=Nelumbo nucifera TaxID=4432 RepID=A0A1U7ZT46_NELNU|nr:PREDICTED: phosphoglycerate mutase-like protein AT74 [Nelumbo nucifera]